MDGNRRGERGLSTWPEAARRRFALTLRHKLALALGIVLVLVAAQGVAAIVLLTRVTDRSALLVQPAIGRADLLSNIESNLLRHRTLVQSTLWTFDSGIRRRARRELDEIERDVDHWVALYRNQELDENRFAGLYASERLYSDYLGSSQKSLAEFDAGDHTEAVWEYLRSQPAFQGLADRLHDLRRQERDATVALREEIVRDAEVARWPIGVVVVLITVADLLLFSTLSETIRRGLNVLRQGAARIARERFDEPVPRPSESEFAELADAMNNVMIELAAHRDERVRVEEQRRQLDRQRMSQVVQAQEAERARVSRELHDQAAQALTALRYGLGHLRRIARDSDVIAEVDRLSHLSSQTVHQIASLARDLRPSVLDDLGLMPALRGYIHEFGERYGIRIDLSASTVIPRLPPEAETALFRVVQEALTNVAKHARAQRAWVDIDAPNGELRLAVRDDGRGFDSRAIARRDGHGHGPGLGLVGMRERVQLLGGELVIDSSEEGTCLRVTLPSIAMETTVWRDDRPVETATPLS